MTLFERRGPVEEPAHQLLRHGIELNVGDLVADQAHEELEVAAPLHEVARQPAAMRLVVLAGQLGGQLAEARVEQCEERAERT